MQVWDHHEGSLSKRLAFESLICASFILSIVQGLAQMIPSLEVNGWMISVTKLFVSPVLSLALAGGFAAAPAARSSTAAKKPSH